MKKLLCIFTFLLLLVSPALADASFFTTDAVGNPQADFGIDDNIWFNLTLPKEGLSLTTYWWTSPDNSFYYTWTNPTASAFTRFSINDVDFPGGSSWDDIKNYGLWNVAATYSYPGAGDISGRYEANFRIVPEPLSAGLFVLGGLGLAIVRRKKA